MVFYVGYNVVYTVSCSVAGALADRFPKTRVLASGYLLAALPAAALILPGDSFAKFAAIFALSGVYMGFWETVEGSAAAELLPSAVRGVGFGVLATVNGLGDLFFSALVGVLWTLFQRWRWPRSSSSASSERRWWTGPERQSRPDRPARGGGGGDAGRDACSHNSECAADAPVCAMIYAECGGLAPGRAVRTLTALPSRANRAGISATPFPTPTTCATKR